jgi:hypothetical protein
LHWRSIEAEFLVSFDIKGIVLDYYRIALGLNPNYRQWGILLLPIAQLPPLADSKTQKLNTFGTRSSWEFKAQLIFE